MKIRSALLALLTFSIIHSPLSISASTGCTYPTTLDAWVDKISGDQLTIADVNQFRCAIEKIQIELGTLPKGNFATVKDRLNNAIYAGGISGGQTINGGQAESEVLTLSSTTHETKGAIFLGATGAFDDGNGRLGIGTQAPETAIHVVKDASINLVMSAAGSPASPAFIGRTIVGSHASPTAVGSGAVLADFIGQGYDGDSFEHGALVRAATIEAWSGSQRGSAVEFWTVASGTTTLGRAGRIIGGYGLELDTASSFIRLQEEATNITTLSDGTTVGMYLKGDKLIFAFNDGGTMRWKSLTLSGTGTTWAETTTPP